MESIYAGQLTHGNVEMMVLRVLAKSPLHVYGIKKELYLCSDGYFGMSEGRLYPLLKKFERRGYVIGSPAISGTGRRVREYRLTSDGKAELDARMKGWRIFAAKLNKVLGL